MMRQWKSSWALLLSLWWGSTTVLGISLLNGRFETDSDVQDYLNLALDAAAMKEADDLGTKLDIYQNGLFGSDVTLQSLSVNAREFMAGSPMYNIFLHAFLILGNVNEGEAEGKFDGNDVEVYADTLVNDLFTLNVGNIETEAAVVLNVWMAAVHFLFEALSNCKAGESPAALVSLDKTAALWIGEGQEDGSNEAGHLLYNLAEIAGERFDQDNGETQVNTEVIDAFLNLQTEFEAGRCNTGGYAAIRDVVKATVGLMTVPLVQNLIHHSMNLSNDGGSSFVELYALATIPRVAACDPVAYDEELHLDVLRELQQSQVEESIDAIQKAYSCLGISCSQVGSYLDGTVEECSDMTSVTAAGYYTPRAGATAKAFLDRDIEQMDIFLRFGAFDSAKDWYEYGWNAEGYTLQGLANNEVVPSGAPNSYIDIFAAYDEEVNFADSIITNVLDQVAPFDSATVEQSRKMVTGMLKYVVMFITSATSLQYAVQQCSSDHDTAMEFWDTGALWYVGSMEGEAPNGKENGGVLLYTTAKENCADFGTCLETGDTFAAAVNDVVMSGLLDGIDLIDTGSCEAANSVLNDEILPNMIIPLFQGTIRYAFLNTGLTVGTTASSFTTGDTFARGILPLIDLVAPASAATIAVQTEFQLDSPPIESGFSAIVDAVTTALASMTTSCTDIGVFETEANDVNFCGSDSVPTAPVDVPTAPTDAEPTDAPDTAPVASPPTETSDFAFGRYAFQYPSVIENDASFALDVRDMYQATSLALATSVYTDGKNALVSGLTGTTGTLTLSALSLDAARLMINDPMFNYFRYALYEEDDLEDESGEDFIYADDVVVEALTNGADNQLAAEAVTVLSVWMAMVHQLYNAVQLCWEKDDPGQMIDSAVALWIGKEQNEGVYEHGWMIYAIGQSAAQFYGLDEGEAPVNTALMTMFNEAQAIGNTCHGAGDDEPYQDLYFKVQELIRTLTKPLILNFLYHLVSEGKNMVELYAVSIVPQAYACSEDMGDNFEAAFFKGYTEDVLTGEIKNELISFLRCQRITSEDLAYGDSADEKLKAFIETLDSGLNAYSDQHLPIAGYTPNSDVSEIARMDMDVFEIQILMRTQAYKAASDIYWYGHNSYSGTASRFRTLVSLVNEVQTGEDATFATFKEYFGDGLYANAIMSNAFDHAGAFASATRGELAQIAFRTLQTMITFQAVVHRVFQAEEHCSSGDDTSARHAWNSAVALYVGSLEGPLAGGRPGGDGGFLYALGNQVCDDFNICEASGESRVNQELIIQFNAGREALESVQCDYITRLGDEEIVPRLITLLVQGTVTFATETMNAAVRDPDPLASAHILEKSVIPYVSAANTTSAATLESAMGDFTTIATGQPVDSILAAFAYALRGMGIDCNDVADPTDDADISFCLASATATDDDDSEGNVPDEAPVADTPTNLGNGLYVTTTYVQDRANIAKDIADMQEALTSNNFNMAKLIYTDGKNSQVYNEDGKFESLRSIKGFSTDETNEMTDEPLFNTFMYALQGSDGKFLSADVRLYADSVVEGTFAKSDQSLPVEAALILNIWMHIAHVLYEALKNCENKQIKDEDGVHFTDIAVAYWIGDGQVAGSSDNGHLLYALAERMGEVFNMDETGQSRTNTNILKLFNEAKTEISLPGACSDSPSSFLGLSRIVNDIISVMAIPLIQGLIHSLRTEDADRVKVYSYAVVPLTAGCNPSSYAYLKDKLINSDYNVVDMEEIILHIRGLLPCLGLSCNDIGVHDSEMADDKSRCVDPDVYTAMAGYKPASDVREYARLDLDLRQLDILLQMKAYTAAENLYTYGKNVKDSNGGSMSLYNLATTSERSIVPEYDAFLRYYESEYTVPSKYADEIIRSALTNANNAYTDEQRAVIVLKTAQVMVMYFAALQALYEAVSACQNTASFRTTGSTDLWDRGAAMLIGSLEGALSNGTQYGYMYYDLAQDYCANFGTCNGDGSGVDTNEELISLLYSGRGSVLSHSCNSLSKEADEISKLLLVPVIQGALLSATKLSQSNVDDANLLRAEGYVYSQATLPLVNDANQNAAKTIKTYMGMSAPSSTSSTASEVFSAYANVYPEMGVDCELIGVTSGNNACTGVVYDDGASLVWIIVGVVLGLCVCCSGAWYCRSRKKVAKLPENNPKFVASENGELNHSMDLLEKAFSSNSRIAQSGETAPLAEDMHYDASPGEDEDFEEATALKSSRSDII